MGQQPTFGEILHRSRQGAGLTQEALAGRAGVSARTISDLERGMKHRPRPDTVQRLMAALPLSQQERTLFERAARDAREAAAQPAAIRTAERSLLGTPRRLHACAPRDLGGSVSVPDHRPPLVGRAHEQAILESHLRGAGPPLLVLAGEPGIGKTRLLRAAVDRAATLGLHVVQGGGPCLGEPTYCEPLLSALRGHLRARSPVHLRADLEGCAWLVRLLPELVDGPIGSLPAMTVAAEQEWYLIAEAVGRFLSNVAGPAGTLLVLDDLHRADTTALALLATLLQAPVPIPLRVVGAYREAEIRREGALWMLLADLAHARLVTHLRLPPLAMEEAARLLAALLDDGDDVGAAWAERDQVLHQAGGVPFYVVAWAEERRRQGGEPVATEVPWAVRHSINRRVDAALPAARPVLEALTVAGGHATCALLAAVAGLADEEVLGALEAACLARLVEQDNDHFRFAYGAVRASIEADLGAARRMQLRRRLGHLLERGRDGRSAPWRRGESAAGNPRYEAVPTALGHAVTGGAAGDNRRGGPTPLEERAEHLAVLMRHHALRCRLGRLDRRPAGG